VFALTVHVYRETEILARFEKIELLFEQQGVCAEIDVLLARHQTIDNFFDLRVHQRLATGDGHRRNAAFFYRLEAFFRCQVALKNVCRILNFAAARARQIAAEQWFKHQHERVTFAASELLFEDISRYG